MKTIKIGIASCKDMKVRTLAIARGKLKPKSGDPKVWLTSTEGFAKVLSNKNRTLLATIAARHPVSLQERRVSLMQDQPGADSLWIAPDRDWLRQREN